MAPVLWAYLGIRILQDRPISQRKLDRQVERVQEAGGKVAQTHLKVGRADDKIVSLAEELGAGLVVMGSRGQGGIRRALMGSISSSVIEHAHCPVMVVRH